MTGIPIRFVDRTNDGETSYWVKQGQFYLGRVVRIRPGAWMVEGHAEEFATRNEAGQFLAKVPKATNGPAEP